jgi:malate/lactate dehydrogenase
VNAKIDGKPALDLVDRTWYENEFFPDIQKRGAAVIAARGKSSAASAAQGALDGMKSLIYPTSKDDWFSMGVYSQGNTYNIDPDLVFSFPCRSSGDGKISIVKEVPWDAFLKEKIALVERELIEERSLVKGLL